MTDPAPNTLADDMLYGAKDIGAFLGISRKRVFALLEHKKIPSFKLGSQWCARRSRLVEFVNAQDQENDPSAPALKHASQHIGIVGNLLGARENAVLYLAALMIFMILILLGILMILDESLRPEILKIFGSVCLAAVGYIGGLMSK